MNAEQALRAAWLILEPYVDHTAHCMFNPAASNPDSDYCTCDLAGAKAKLRELLRRAQTADGAQPQPPQEEA